MSLVPRFVRIPGATIVTVGVRIYPSALHTKVAREIG